MKLHVDLETLELIAGPGFRSPVSALRFKRGDAARLEVVFLTGGTTPAAIGDPESLELHFGAKPQGGYDSGYLVHTADWTLPEPEAPSPSYQCAPSFNTVELDTALGVGSGGPEPAEIPLMGEITWREDGGEPTSTRTFLVMVENDVNRGTEGPPSSLGSPYPAPENLVTQQTLGDRAVLHDAAQSLTNTQKSRARANIGAVSQDHTQPYDSITGRPVLMDDCNAILQAVPYRWLHVELVEGMPQIIIPLDGPATRVTIDLVEYATEGSADCAVLDVFLLVSPVSEVTLASGSVPGYPFYDGEEPPNLGGFVFQPPALLPGAETIATKRIMDATFACANGQGILEFDPSYGQLQGRAKLLIKTYPA